MSQLKLFEYEGALNFRQIWELKKAGIEDAAGDLITLLQEAACNPPLRALPVTLYDLAKQRLGLSQEDIPPQKVEVFQTLVTQIRDERYRLKARVEELTEFRLVFVNDLGESSLNGGRRPTMGFNFRDSDAGAADDNQRVKMLCGGLSSVVKRRPDLLRPVLYALGTGGAPPPPDEGPAANARAAGD